MPQTTPTPRWTIVTHDGAAGPRYEIRDGESVVARVSTGGTEREATMLAAAPDLHAACEALLAVQMDALAGGTDAMRRAAAIDLARAALARVAS